MGSHCEIVELEEDLNYSKKSHQSKADVVDKGKKPLMFSNNKSIEDDINKLFEGINVRTSFHGLTLSDETGGFTPRRNASKKPMRMSTSSSSSGIGYAEPVSLKQALRGLCISQASEMAAMKRLSKLPGSPALSDSVKFANAYRSAKESGITSVAEIKQESSRKMLPPEPSLSKKKVAPVQLNEILREPDSIDHVQVKNVISVNHASSSIPPPPPPAVDDGDSLKTKSKSKSVVNEDKSSKVVNKATPLKLRRKGKLQSVATSSSSATGSSKLGKSTRPVKTIIRNKSVVKKKSKPELTSTTPVVIPNVKKNVETSHLVCEKCHCALKTTENEPKNSNSKSGRVDKSEFTQSSNSSIGEYSTSTSISEESNLSSRRCSIGNKPHMSKMDTRWQAIHRTMKQNGFLGLRHFNLLKKLGCGDIGTVYLAELVGTSCVFAIKVMDNEFLERRKKMPRAHTEREILRILDHPFLPTLYAHFVSENLSCLVMEYCPGGDLHVLRQKQPSRHYHEQAARFYVAEVLLALEYLHMLGIVYRDLKPENILVREDGHIMLTDFDLSLRCTVNPTLLQSPDSIEPPRMSGPCAGSNCIDPFCLKPTCQVSCFTPRIKKTKTKTKPETLTRSFPQLVAEPTEARSNSFVGTHEYLAPEIIKGEGHGSAVDWWTFGIFLYELLYGKTPFKGVGNDDTLANVVLQSLKFPETPLVSFQARDLIKGLLVKEPENRLGSQRGATEIKQHPFFDGLNWALIRCAIPPEVPLESCDVGVAKSEGNKFLEFELF